MWIFRLASSVATVAAGGRSGAACSIPGLAAAAVAAPAAARVVTATAARASAAPAVAGNLCDWRRVRRLLRLVVSARLLAADAVEAHIVAASGSCDSGSCCVTVAAARSAVPADATDLSGSCCGRRQRTATGAIVAAY